MRVSLLLLAAVADASTVTSSSYSYSYDDQSPPSPPPPADDDPCFPSTSVVALADGFRTTIDKLRPGDAIVAATAAGALGVGTVSVLSTVKPEAASRPFVRVTTTDAARVLTLTPEHHVPVGAECCSTLKKAKDVSVGETMGAVKDGKAVATTSFRCRHKTVTKINGVHMNA